MSHDLPAGQVGGVFRQVVRSGKVSFYGPGIWSQVEITSLVHYINGAGPALCWWSAQIPAPLAELGLRIRIVWIVDHATDILGQDVQWQDVGHGRLGTMAFRGGSSFRRVDHRPSTVRSGCTGLRHMGLVIID